MIKDKLPHKTFKLGSLEEIPSGQGRCYVIDDEEIAVFRQRDGGLFATANRCPHNNGSLADGLVGNNKVICPLHARQFDLSTGRCSGNEPCIRTFKIMEKNGIVHLKKKHPKKNV